MKIKRVWMPISSWEELHFNMWGEVSNRSAYLFRAQIFTGNHRLYGRYMQKVTHEWPNSCANALTDYNLNRKAWIGHAACALALRCPEDITRQAWGYLSDEQRLLANRQADRAILSWEMRYKQSQGIRVNVGEQMLQIWHSGRGAEKSGGFRSRPVMASNSYRPAQE
jgi:hypothetical protein